MAYLQFNHLTRCFCFFDARSEFLNINEMSVGLQRGYCLARLFAISILREAEIILYPGTKINVLYIAQRRHYELQILL
jgi:hypothetical protein